MLKVIIGIIIGYIFGVFTMALLTAASEADDLIEEMMNKHEEDNANDC